MFNYRHPGPRRVWKVGSELQSTTLDPLDPLDPGDPGDPGMSSKSGKFVAQASENEPDVVLALCFFDFFKDVSCESPTFETPFGRVASRNGLETYGFT